MRILFFIVAILWQCAVISAQTREMTLLVKGACSMCQDRIEAIAGKQPSVQRAVYNLDSQMLTCTVKDGFDKEPLVASLLAAGHDADGRTADQKALMLFPTAAIIGKRSQLRAIPFRSQTTRSRFGSVVNAECVKSE